MRLGAALQQFLDASSLERRAVSMFEQLRGWVFKESWIDNARNSRTNRPFETGDASFPILLWWEVQSWADFVSFDSW